MKKRNSSVFFHSMQGKKMKLHFHKISAWCTACITVVVVLLFFTIFDVKSSLSVKKKKIKTQSKVIPVSFSSVIFLQIQLWTTCNTNIYCMKYWINTAFYWNLFICTFTFSTSQLHFSLTMHHRSCMYDWMLMCSCTKMCIVMYQK